MKLVSLNMSLHHQSGKRVLTYTYELEDGEDIKVVSPEEPPQGPYKKYCPGCKCEKPTSEFYKNRRNADGLQSACKVCHNTYVGLTAKRKKY